MRVVGRNDDVRAQFETPKPKNRTAVECGVVECGDYVHQAMMIMLMIKWKCNN